MYRQCAIFVSFVVVILSFASCASAPSSSADTGIVRYGAGSIEDDPSHVNRAAAPGMMQRVKVEELLAQAKIHEADLDERLAAFDFSGAVSAFDSIVDLIGGIPSASSRLQDIRQKVDSALDSIVIESIGTPSDTMVGSLFKKDFSVRVFALSSDQKKPVSSFDLVVAYPGVASDGAAIIQTGTAKTAADGVAAFTAPAPVRAGKGKLVFSSALSSRDPVLAASIAKRKESGKLSLSFPHLVTTNARTMSTTISILDFDKNGKPVGSSSTSATTLLKPLVQKGFRRIGMADFLPQLAAGDEAALIKSAKALFSGGVQRFIYGTTRVDALEQSADGTWSCTVTAKISVWDFTSDRAVYTTTLSRTETGKTEAAVLGAARVKLAGEDIFEDLLYNM